MKETSISIRGAIAQSKWSIPVPESNWRAESEAMEDYQVFEHYMESYGFKKIHEVNSLRHSSLIGENRGVNAPETFGLWHHPVGIIAITQSYSYEGYTTSEGVWVPTKKKLNKMCASARVDLGTGRELLHQAACSLPGTGATDPQLDGSKVRTISGVFHSCTESLAQFLFSIQTRVKFIPISEWKTLIGEETIYINKEFIYPLLEKPNGEFKNENDLLLGQDEGALWDAFLATMTDDIREVMRPHGLQKKNDEDEEKSRNKIRQWKEVENALKLFSEALSFDNKRWRGSYNSGLLQHWVSVACGEAGEDIAKWRPYEDGDANLSLPVALIHAKASTGAQDRLKRLLEDAPLDVLERWATVPDKTGYTLGMHAVLRSFVERNTGERSNTPPENLAVDILTILHNRLGPEKIVMTTEKRSLMGIPLHFDDKKLHTIFSGPINSFAAQKEFSEAVVFLEACGVEWSRDIKWRNYPNTMTDKRNKPRFFAVEGPVDLHTWKDLMGERYSDELDVVGTLLTFKQLERISKAVHVPEKSLKLKM